MCNPDHPRHISIRLQLTRRSPHSGGAFKVQIYSPYVVMNKTGLPFYIRSTRSNRPGGGQDLPGETNPNVLATPTPYRRHTRYTSRVVSNTRESRFSSSRWQGVPFQDRGVDLVEGSRIFCINKVLPEF